MSYLDDALGDTSGDLGVFGDKPQGGFGPTTDTKPTKKAKKAGGVFAVTPPGKVADTGVDTHTDDSSDGPPDENQIGQSDYKFTAVTNPNGEVEDYTKTPATESGYTEGGILRGDVAQQGSDPKQMSASEYDTLTKEASKGNKLAQNILVSGDYKAHDYPTLSQDLQKIEDPFVQALSGLPALAQNEQAAANKVTQPYDFSNAEGQVNNMLGQMGSSMQMTTSPETSAYLGTLQGIVGQGANNLTTSNLGLPSIMSALGGLGPAAKTSTQVAPYASLLAALLSHQQYETVYGGQAPASTGDPAWLQNLIASVTGTAIGGGLVSPTVAAGGVGTTPSTSTTPTGSNA